MNRRELEERRYITSISNAKSICQRGILSHKLAAKISHESVAMVENPRSTCKNHRAGRKTVA